MPSFRALPPSLIGASRPRIPGLDAKRIHIPVARAMVDCGVYVDGSTAARQVHPRGRPGQGPRTRGTTAPTAFVWVGLHEPDEHQMQAVAEVFGLHPLAVEDAVHAHQRPKLERYDNTLFLVLKTVNYVEHESVALAREIVETGEIMIFVGPDFVVTVRHGDHSGLAGRAQEDGRRAPSSWRWGPYAVMHAIADHVVDSYLDVTELIECDIDAIEEEAFSPNSEDRHRAHLPAQARGRRTAPGRRPAVGGAAAGSASDHKDLIVQGGPALHARRARPPTRRPPTGSPATTRC